MGKNNKKKQRLDEAHLILPHYVYNDAEANSNSCKPPIVDTHTHLLSTFSAYRSKYPSGRFETVYDFARAVTSERGVEAIVDVFCEAPVQNAWRELADSAVTEEDRWAKWGGVEYWFVMGVHPHEAKSYSDDVEAEIFTAMTHPRCVGWGEIGLDYHYNLSPPEVQRAVFERQLRHAVRLGKPLTIHTREAEEDTERILKAEVPREHKIHVHCFTDSPEFAQRLLDSFPNLCIGITGVITYATNQNTSNVIRNLVKAQSATSASASGKSSAFVASLRIVLETDAPYMVPGNIYKSLPELKPSSRLPLCHTGMIPWTAEFVAGVANETMGASEETADGDVLNVPPAAYDAARVMRESRENARRVYGV